MGSRMDALVSLITAFSRRWPWNKNQKFTGENLWAEKICQPIFLSLCYKEGKENEIVVFEMAITVWGETHKKPCRLHAQRLLRKLTRYGKMD